jgi:hypothetical protein
MGLGPPVCQHCQVIGELLDKPVPLIKAKGSGSMMTHTNWVCPICGETDLLDHAGFSNYDKYHENEKVLRFLLNKPKEKKMK